ncbi:MAG: SPASM domain-containing protein [Desulfitobacteriia bacterium]
MPTYNLGFNTKASVFPYFESDEQFGCGAGSQHSYVDIQGNYGPCDFLDLKYGNLLTDNIQEVWQRMHDASGRPKCFCLAKNPNMNPVSANTSVKLPKFYQLLGGDSLGL